MKRLTKRVVEQTKPGTKDKFLWDSELRGFGLKVTPAGRRVYVVQYRTTSGKSRRMALGPHGPLTTESARRMAKEVLGRVAAGEDPMEDRKQKKKQKETAAITVSELADRFLEEAAGRKKPTSLRNDRSYIERFIKPRIGSLRVDSIEREHITRIHGSLKSTPYQANRVLALLSKMFNLAEVWGYRPQHSNPCRGIQKFREHPRQRFLSAEEIARLNKALEDQLQAGANPLAVAAIRLLIVTGWRKSEVLSLKWEYINFDQGVVRLPDSKTGQQIFPINEIAREILRSIPRRPDSPYVFPSERTKAHIADLRPLWPKALKAAGLEGVRLHDLRHTYASHAAGTGLSLSHLQRLMGHKEIRTTLRYAHLENTDILREASEHVARSLTNATRSPAS